MSSNLNMNIFVFDTKSNMGEISKYIYTRHKAHARSNMKEIGRSLFFYLRIFFSLTPIYNTKLELSHYLYNHLT